MSLECLCLCVTAVVTLSEAGQRLLSYFGRIGALFQEAIASVKEDGVPGDALRIGSLEQTLSQHLLPTLMQYTARYPAVALTITTGNTPDLIEQVLEHSVMVPSYLGPLAAPAWRKSLSFAMIWSLSQA